MALETFERSGGLRNLGVEVRVASMNIQRRYHCINLEFGFSDSGSRLCMVVIWSFRVQRSDASVKI